MNTKIITNQKTNICMTEFFSLFEKLEKNVLDKNDIYNVKLQYNRQLQKLSKKFNKNNYVFLSFLLSKINNGISMSRLCRYIIVYRKYLNEINLNIAQIEEYENIFYKIKSSKNKPQTKLNEWNIIKLISKFVNKKIDLSNYHIKFRKIYLTNNDLLTQKEKSLILGSNIDFEKKIFLSILFETGCRVGEIFGIRRHNIKLYENMATIKVNGKTGVRNVFCIRSLHFIKILLKTNWIKWNFSYYSLKKALKRFEKKIKKRIYPHLARHTRATELIKSEVSIITLKKFFGWSKNSDMVDHYVHLSQDDVFNEIIKKDY